jgi:hypothetical protein
MWGVSLGDYVIYWAGLRRPTKPWSRRVRLLAVLVRRWFGRVRGRSAGRLPAGRLSSSSRNALHGRDNR